ncbi:Putative IQ motif, EF-hand binding, pseudouridine synthase, RsuA/RluA, pseudouridine synthase, RluA [Colletotrichum destructivum]|uniref:Pseudouridine synthase n=1 Tax=Colletotrichum destructivum TaxID=34406 RepID=A0AAX4J0Q6_9PEZI|nr:Putative IQ motif, EF-hand binding, pseudouridine synthase, RsuA/RluA, pseudouridine synthase, RluA [Colletotrichum destructivum]
MASDKVKLVSAPASLQTATFPASVAKPSDMRPSEASEKQSDVLTTPTGDMWPRPYYFEDGLRRVAPYHFTYHTWAKERWRGRKLVDIFEDEFRDRTLEYYRHAMETGAIVVNGKAVGPDHVVKNGDLVNHTIHRHEPPVTAEPIRVIHEDDEMIVVNKPSGVPVHPAGRYKYNSLIEIMKAERGEHFLPYPCHRLDRLTSGILFIGKTPQGAVKLTAQIRAHTVRKEYLARVAGKFPDGEVICDQPILQISPRLGLNRVRANGKSARTVFKRLAYYPPETQNDSQPQQPKTPEQLAEEERRPWIKKEGYSIVRCLPLTGRTHQIRVHLQFVGHPIQNDPLYANQRVWGINLGCNDSDAVENTDEDIMSRLERMGKQDIADAVAYHDEMVDLYAKRRAEKLSGKNCEICDTPLYTDPGEHELSLWLHSLRYEDAGGAWGYTSPMPGWALPPDGMNGPTEVGGLEELVEAIKDENPEVS